MQPGGGFGGMRALRGMAADPVRPGSIDRRTLRRAWSVTKRHRALIIVYLATLAISALLGALVPLVVRDIINVAIVRRSIGRLTIDVVIIAALSLAQSALGVGTRYVSSVAGERIIFDLRTRLVAHLQELSLGFFTEAQTGSVLSRISSDVTSSQAVVGTLGSVVSDLSTLIFTLGFMVALSPLVTALSLLIVPVFVLVDRLLSRRVAHAAREQMQANAEMNAFTQERFNVSGALLVALFGRRGDELDTFSHHAGRVRDAGVRFALVGRVYFAILGLASAIGTIAVYALGGDQVIRGALSLGSLVALAQYVTRLTGPITDLSSARVNLLQALVSFDRIFEVLDVQPAVTSPPNPRHLQRVEGRVALEDVWFRYPRNQAVASLTKQGVPRSEERDWALAGVTLHVEPGHTLALVGPSGAGKTTVTMLVTRMWDPERGRVTLDGIDLRELDLEELRAEIGVVTQDPFLFHDTVRANLRYAKPSATEDELRDALARAQLLATIEALPDRLDTLVGERGYRLSGGEKQRLAIARVLLRNPRIVILDEATSSLDAQNEALIQSAIGDTLQGRTAIVIAHRLSTVLGADTIAVMAAGSVVEQGSHAELLAAGGLYAELFERQFLTEQGEATAP
ncbi:ABC transporter related [Acidimicrobium ferrooxidans DSM 10331]|uniref:ABC transporter related n=1 Tax=Acidimicrobium ferrooxidans (strain DSM 10331 / JCM 15462 / NBRC 103882 / ICP) TaxID=525909 RepID=C7M2J5_ACIFD|nr:ABC transporter ATP-binding protein [Acidimicrobium ferrooxidans]ACU53239.1 ABC transporter related [Acidimicrobium ferrooxidans DSM 10331]